VSKITWFGPYGLSSICAPPREWNPPLEGFGIGYIFFPQERTLRLGDRVAILGRGIAAVLQEAARILAPGGSLALLDWRSDTSPPPGPPADHRLPAAGVLQFLVKSGWTTDGPANIGHYSYFIGAIPPSTIVSATS
jgi:hypothetical protein